MDIVNDIKHRYKNGSIIIKVLLVNIAVFIGVNVIDLIFFLSNALSQTFAYRWLAFPSNPAEFVQRPWSLLTYMFTHEGFMHILFNMLWWYWLGIIFVRFFTQKQLFGLYVLGGFGGALLYMLAFNVLPVFEAAAAFSGVIGASASVLALTIAIAVYAPDFKLNLLFVGAVPMKYFALVVVALDIINIKSGNAGGHIAHLGGALVGYWYAIQFKKGNDITAGINRFFDKIVRFVTGKKSPNMRVEYKRKSTTKKKSPPKKAVPRDDIEYNKTKNAQQAELDRILEKISKSGYGALTKAEKDLLFKISNDND